jgi:hypothetical protein
MIKASLQKLLENKIPELKQKGIELLVGSYNNAPSFFESFTCTKQDQSKRMGQTSMVFWRQQSWEKATRSNLQQELYIFF